MRDRNGVLRGACSVVFGVSPSTECECRDFARAEKGTVCASCGHAASHHGAVDPTVPQWDSDDEADAFAAEDPYNNEFDDTNAADDGDRRPSTSAGRTAGAKSARSSGGAAGAGAGSPTAGMVRGSRNTKSSRGRRKRGGKRGAGNGSASGRDLMSMVASPVKTGGSGVRTAWGDDRGSTGRSTVRSRASTRSKKSLRRVRSDVRMGGPRSGDTTQPRRVLAREGNADWQAKLTQKPSKKLTRTELSASLSRLTKPPKLLTAAAEEEERKQAAAAKQRKVLSKQQLEDSVRRLAELPDTHKQQMHLMHRMRGEPATTLQSPAKIQAIQRNERQQWQEEEQARGSGGSTARSRRSARSSKSRGSTAHLSVSRSSPNLTRSLTRSEIVKSVQRLIKQPERGPDDIPEHMRPPRECQCVHVASDKQSNPLTCRLPLQTPPMVAPTLLLLYVVVVQPPRSSRKSSSVPHWRGWRSQRVTSQCLASSTW